MTKIQTKSGFVWDVDEKRVGDWRFAKQLAKCEGGNEAERIMGLTYVVPFLLGDDGETALSEHVKKKNGAIMTSDILAEFREILVLLGEEAKKSKSSQE